MIIRKFECENPILSILIATVEGREEMLSKLLYSLLKDGNDTFEVITAKDNKEISIGDKRQLLLNESKGEYVVFIDDDDTVSDHYVSSIVDACLEGPDGIGFKISCIMNGKGPFLASASNIWEDWAEDKGGFKYVRTPYHKTPIKREIALQIGYKDMRFREDYDYSKRLKESKLIKTEVYIDEFLYFYNYKQEDPKQKYGIKD